MTSFFDWANNVAGYIHGSLMGMTAAPATHQVSEGVYPLAQVDDPRLEPVAGDWVDELVNDSLARGRRERK